MAAAEGVQSMTGVDLRTFCYPQAGMLNATKREVWEQLLYTVHLTARNVRYGT